MKILPIIKREVIETIEDIKEVFEKPSPVPDELAPQKGTDIISYAISIMLSIALVGGLVMKEKMRLDYMNNQPELRLHSFIKKAKSKGHKIDAIRKALVSKGWPAHVVDSASLHDVISVLSKKGYNNTLIRQVLKSKGFDKRIVENAIVNNHIEKELKKRKSVKSIRNGLIKAGWDKRMVEKKLPAK